MNLVFLLEERSAREMLKGLLPRLLCPNVVPRYVVFEGKQHLERSIERRLRKWLAPDTAFVVIRDQDASDCRQVKATLAAKCARAGKPDALVRIACHELETFYLGDLAAVERGLGLPGLARQQDRRKYRAPDRLRNPAAELARMTRDVYQKVAGSRAIGPELSLCGNRSDSFRALVDGLLDVADADS